MKKISICIPCYNEELNIRPLYDKLQEVLNIYKNTYEFEFIFADNDSSDASRDILRSLANEDKRVKAIFNTRNFGPVASNRNSLLSASGDAVITIVCDFQEPPELITEFIRLWEMGNLVVCGQKSVTAEHGFKKYARKIYYKIIKNVSDVKQYEQVTGFALYDRKVIEDVRRYNDPNVALRHVLAEIGYPVTLVPFKQSERRAGKSSYNISRYFDFAISSLVNTSFFPIRLVTVLGLIVAVVSFLVGCVYLIYKLVFWDSFALGMAPVLIGMCFLGAVQLFFLGIIGEYVAAIMRKVNDRPAVFELERINFDSEEDK